MNASLRRGRARALAHYAARDGPHARAGVRARTGQPDRRAHRLQRRVVPAVCRRARGDGHGHRARARDSTSRPGRSTWARRTASGWAPSGRPARAGAPSYTARWPSCGATAPRPPPCRLEISGDLPRGAGLSSSAALSVALCLALCGLAGTAPPPPVALARLCSRIERDWCGQETGLLDQLASICGEDGRALRIDMRGPEIATVSLPLGDHTLVTLESGAERSLAASGYNERRAECRRAAAALGLGSLRDADPERRPGPCPRRSTAGCATCSRRTPGSTGGGSPGRRGSRRARPAARRLARQPARRLRGVRARHRGRRAPVPRGRRARRAHHGRRLRRLGPGPVRSRRGPSRARPRRWPRGPAPACCRALEAERRSDTTDAWTAASL